MQSTWSQLQQIKQSMKQQSASIRDMKSRSKLTEDEDILPGACKPLLRTL